MFSESMEFKNRWPCNQSHVNFQGRLEFLGLPVSLNALQGITRRAIRSDFPTTASQAHNPIVGDGNEEDEILAT